MAGAGKKWFIGCGIGCGLMLIILVGMGSCTYFSFKKIENRVEELEVSAEALVDLYGQVADFTPPPDGAIAPDRMEAFLAVRRATVDGGNDLAKHLAVLDDRPDAQGKEPGKFAKVGAGVKLVPAIFDYADDRNHALLDVGMGMGEYAYIYMLSYFVFLDKDLTDGPGFSVMDDDDDEDDNVRWSYNSGSSDKEAVREKRERELRDYMNDIGQVMLTNQLNRLHDERSLPGGLDAGVWRRQLSAEVQLLEEESRRLPWEEGLPDHIAAALEIYRFDLEESYDDLVNPIDIGLTQQD